MQTNENNFNESNCKIYFKTKQLEVFKDWQLQYQRLLNVLVFNGILALFILCYTG